MIVEGFKPVFGFLLDCFLSPFWAAGVEDEVVVVLLVFFESDFVFFAAFAGYFYFFCVTGVDVGNVGLFCEFTDARVVAAAACEYVNQKCNDADGEGNYERSLFFGDFHTVGELDLQQ